MAERKRAQISKDLVNGLKLIRDLDDTLTAVEHSRPRDRLQLYDQAASLITVAMGDQKYLEPNKIDLEFGSLEHNLRRISDATNKSVVGKKTSELYGKEKEAVYEAIEDGLNAKMKGAKSVHDAATKIQDALEILYKEQIKDISVDQLVAINLKAANEASGSRFNPAQFPKPSAEELSAYQANAITELVVSLGVIEEKADDKNKDAKVYAINEGKLKGLIKDVRTAANVYTKAA